MASKPTVESIADDVVVVETPQSVLVVESSSSSEGESSSDDEPEIVAAAAVPVVQASGEATVDLTKANTDADMMESNEEVVMIEDAPSGVVYVQPAPEVCEIVADTVATAQKKTTGAPPKANSSGLGLLAAYGSGSDGSDEDDDDESVEDVEILPVAPTVAAVAEVPDTYEGATAKLNQFIQAGDYRVISDSSEEDESDDDNDQASVSQVINSDSGDSDVEIVSKSKEYVKAKGEMGIDDLPPIEDLQISVPEAECIPLGKIFSVVEQLVLVDSLPGTVPLDLDTVLFLDKGNMALGRVFDVLGNISEPLYCVRFNTNEEIVAKGLTVGTPVYVAPKTEHTTFVILGNLMSEKGCDASWEHDIEQSTRSMEFSDDEEERAARRVRRGKKAAPADNTEEGQKRQRSTSMSSEQSSMNGDGRFQHQRFPRGGSGQRGRGGGFRGRGGHYQQPHYQNSNDWHHRQDNYSWHNNLPYNGPPPHSGYPPHPPPMMNPYGPNNGYPFPNHGASYQQYPPPHQPTLQQMYGNQPMYGHPPQGQPPMQHHQQQPPPPGAYYQQQPPHQ